MARPRRTAAELTRLACTMDEYFALFVEEFVAPTTTQAVPAESFARYTSVLPDCLISFWQSYGWASFGNGLIWLTDPDVYSDTTQYWLSQVADLHGAEYVVFARTAFGDLFAFRPATGGVITISGAYGWIMASKKHLLPAKNRESKMQSFFACATPGDFDVWDENGQPLFESLITRLGPLQRHEVYSFAPFPSKGGEVTIANAGKVSLISYLNSIAKSGVPVLKLM